MFLLRAYIYVPWAIDTPHPPRYGPVRVLLPVWTGVWKIDSIYFYKVA